MPFDSTNQRINIGDRVIFRGKEYTIKNFLYGRGAVGTSQIEFDEKQHTTEIADEISVDRVS